MANIGPTLSKYTGAAELSSLLESDKFGMISVSSYGAKGDGVTDDTTAIQNAINASNTLNIKEIYFTNGKSYVVGTLNNFNGITFIGNNVTIIGNTSVKVNSFSIYFKTFDKISDLVSSKSIKIGDYCTTRGYYSAGDGGAASYLIVAAATGTDDGGSFHDLTGITGQAKLIIEPRMSPKTFGAKTTSGFDNSQIFENMIACQVDYSFGVIDIKNIFEITIDGLYEIHSPILLRPFITIRSNNSHIYTHLETDQGAYGFKAVGDFTSLAVIDTAPFFEDNTRKKLLYASATTIYDSGDYTECENVTLENFVIIGDGTVSTAPFEGIHLCGSNGSVIRNVSVFNTVQGITVCGGWQQRIEFNKFEVYWIGGLFWENTAVYALRNYFTRAFTRANAIWTDVSTRPFYSELDTGGNAYLKEKCIGFVAIACGGQFESNLVEGCVYGVGFDYRPNDPTMVIRDTFIEDATTCYVFYTKNSFDLALGKCTATNLLEATVELNGGTNPNIINIISGRGTEFTQSKVTNLGSVSSNNVYNRIQMVNFQRGTRPTNTYVRYDDIRDYGATINRPVVADSYIGQYFFDTTLGKPLWNNGTNWVDATGST